MQPTPDELEDALVYAEEIFDFVSSLIPEITI